MKSRAKTSSSLAGSSHARYGARLKNYIPVRTTPKKALSRPISPIQFRLNGSSRVEVIDLQEVSCYQQLQIIYYKTSIQTLENELISAKTEIGRLYDKLAFTAARASEAEQRSASKISELQEVNSALRRDLEQYSARFLQFRERRQKADEALLEGIRKLSLSLDFDGNDAARTINAQMLICRKRLERAEARYRIVHKFIESREERILTLQARIDAGAYEIRGLKRQLLFKASSAELVEAESQTEMQEEKERAQDVEKLLTNIATDHALPTVYQVKHIFNAFTNMEIGSMYSVMTGSMMQLVLQSAQLMEFFGFKTMTTKDELMRYMRNQWNTDFEMRIKFFLKRFKLMLTPPERNGALGLRLFNTDFIYEDDAEDVWMMALVYFLLLGGTIQTTSNAVCYTIAYDVVFRVSSSNTSKHESFQYLSK